MFSICNGSKELYEFLDHNIGIQTYPLSLIHISGEKSAGKKGDFLENLPEMWEGNRPEFLCNRQFLRWKMSEFNEMSENAAKPTRKY